MDCVSYRSTVVHCGVLTDDSLVFHVGMVLLVLVHDVIDNLGPAVGQIHSVLTLDDAPLPGLGLGVNVGVAVSIKLVNVVAVRVVMRDDIVNCVNGMNSWSCDSMVSWMNCVRRKAQRNLGNGGCHQGGDAQ